MSVIKVVRQRVGQWPLTVARSLIISKHRPGTTRAARMPIEEEEPQPGRSQIKRAHPTCQAAEAINGLSSDHPEVIIELVYRRRTVSEAAEVLGVPPGTVKLAAILRCTPCAPHWKNND